MNNPIMCGFKETKMEQNHNIYIKHNICVKLKLSTARGFRESIMSNELEYKPYSNSVFGAWDYSVNDERNAYLIMKGIQRDITVRIFY